MRVYLVSYITNVIRLYIWLSKLWIIKPLFSTFKLIQLENSMLMYGIYNMETLEKLINTVHNIHNTTSSHEKLFAGQQSSLKPKSLYAHSLGLHDYSINSLLYLWTIQDKYIALYRELITQLQIYTSAIRILARGYLPNTLVTPSKLKEILNEFRTALWTNNPDYDLVINRLHLYYDIQLVTFSPAKDKNLIQFPVFIQPYTQQPLILIPTGNSTCSNYRPEHTSTFWHTITSWKTKHCIKFRNLHLPMTARIKNLQKNWL